MFKIGLLTSTAMTAVTFLLSGADAAQVQTDMHVANRDPNTRFLCTYGQFLVSAFSDGGVRCFCVQLDACGRSRYRTRADGASD